LVMNCLIMKHKSGVAGCIYLFKYLFNVKRITGLNNLIQCLLVF